MPVDPNNVKHTYSYTDDFGTVWNIVLSAKVATAGTFSAGVPGAALWPRQNRRHRTRVLHGTTADGTQSASVPAPTSAAYQSIFNTGSFNITDTTYLITGRTGEHVSNIPPPP